MNTLLKTVIAVLMLSAWGAFTSCTSESSPDTHLQHEVDGLQKRTIPPDSRLIDQHLPTIHGWVARADWEFQTNHGSEAYHQWLADKLRPDFQIQQGTSPSTRFSKHDQGDVEMLWVVTTPSAGMLRVTVKLEIYPE